MDKEVINLFREQIKPLCSELASLLQQISYPLSVSITKSLINNITKLKELIDNSTNDMDVFLDYITFPLLLILEKDYIFRRKQYTANGIPVRILENTLDCLASCFEKVNSMDQLEKFIALYQSLFIIHVTYPDDVNTSGSTELFTSTSVGSGEELKTSIINSFRKLINSKWNHYSSQNGSLFTLHTTSLFVSKILDVTTKERNRELVELSVRTICDLLQVTKIAISHKDPSEFSNIIDGIFPGLISQVCKLIIQPPYISTKVQCAAFELFSLITCMNCADSINIAPNSTEIGNIMEGGSVTIETLSNAVFSIDEKNKNNGKFEKFEPFLKKVFSMEVYSLYGSSVSIDDVTEIQQCILDKCSIILAECNQTLNSCSSCLVECLLAGGRKIELAEFSNDSQDSFIQLVKSIPNICKTTTNERQKVSTYNLFHNYLDFILQTENGIEFVFSEQIMHELLLSLMISLQMDRYNPITEENEYPKKSFQHFVDDRMIQVVYNICKLIGKQLGEKSTTYIDYLLNLSVTAKSAEHSYKNEAILIVNCILEGILQRDTTTEESKLKSCINSLVDNISERLNENSSESVETNCLLLETISIVCRFIERKEEERDMFLLKILYPILNQLGYSSIHITQSCFKTIANISFFFYPNNNFTPRENVMNILVSNFDYMIDDIRYRLKYLSVYPHIPRVLNTLFEFNVMGKRFEEKSNATQYINTVTIVEDCIQSVFNAIDQQTFEKSYSKSAFSTLFSVLGNIIKTINILKIEREKLDISGKKELSEKEIETVKSILQKLQHFMNSSQNTLITSVSFLSIIENAINMFQNSNIRDFDDSTTGNKILPSLHILWPMLMTHLVQKRTAIPLKQRTIELLKVMAVKFDDFLFGRLMSDLTPYLIRTLKELHSQFVTKYKREPSKLDYFRTEAEFKYLKSILQFYFTVLDTSDYFKEHVKQAELQSVSETLKSLYLSEDIPSDFLSLSERIVYMLSLEPLERPEPEVQPEDNEVLIEDAKYDSKDDVE
ncbi:hypothetical protein NAEGRDRAFT_57589 [Naegleria gruberi]|uniref:Uncharacterized protein n=1 Tax=Naegleria gruberi TaxID=5762 RepID=D2VA23_NAEGR|nr:uncharacterized protein NAEGRDRAFT_57589 [Naegleria gruberi]EFC46232.1 hypothetical protein NAEGRDRAFT_57589 [Naegleria gruberi]|eukprot:XP_002678976.1 hypothetical protein NAEGRDRAFT_57589 [Naegleria gruberi strain NEG-M]